MRANSRSVRFSVFSVWGMCEAADEGVEAEAFYGFSRTWFVFFQLLYVPHIPYFSTFTLLRPTMADTPRLTTIPEFVRITRLIMSALLLGILSFGGIAYYLVNETGEGLAGHLGDAEVLLRYLTPIIALAAAAIVGVTVGGIGGLYLMTVAAAVVATLATLLYLRRSVDLPLRHPASGMLRELKKYPQVVRPPSEMRRTSVPSICIVLIWSHSLSSGRVAWKISRVPSSEKYASELLPPWVRRWRFAK